MDSTHPKPNFSTSPGLFLAGYSVMVLVFVSAYPSGEEQAAACPMVAARG